MLLLGRTFRIWKPDRVDWWLPSACRRRTGAKTGSSCPKLPGMALRPGYCTRPKSPGGFACFSRPRLCGRLRNLLRSTRSSSTKPWTSLAVVIEVPPAGWVTGHVRREEPLLLLTLVGLEEGTIAGACRHEVGDVHELEVAGSEGQVGVVALDGQINARAMDQAGNQDIFQHVQIVFARVETHHDQFDEVAMQVGQQPFPYFL